MRLSAFTTRAILPVVSILAVTSVFAASCNSPNQSTPSQNPSNGNATSDAASGADTVHGADATGGDFNRSSSGNSNEGTTNTHPTDASSTTTNKEDTAAGAAGEDTAGVTSESVIFGQSAAFTGITSALGKNMRTGIEIAFHEANASGGIHGRYLELHTLDDAYEPKNAIANTHKLIDEGKVFALIGSVGTPTSEVTAPIAAEQNIPFITPLTGAQLLREDGMEHVINFRASYGQETEKIVRHLIDDLGFTKIAVLFQNDSFGRESYYGVLKALEGEPEESNETSNEVSEGQTGLSPAAIGYYTRNTSTIKTALLDVIEGEPDAVIIAGTSVPTAEILFWAHKIDFNPMFVALSFVGANAMTAALAARDEPAGDGLLITQVVPFYKDNTIASVLMYTNALRDYDIAHNTKTEPDSVSFEGYISGRLAIEGLRRCGIELTRQCFIDSLLGQLGEGTTSVHIDEMTLTFSRQKETDTTGEKINATDEETSSTNEQMTDENRQSSLDNQGSDSVFLTVIDCNNQMHSTTSFKEENLPLSVTNCVDDDR